MNLIQKAFSYFSGSSMVDLSANTNDGTTGPIKKGKYLEHDLKSVWQTRIDIKKWKEAESIYWSQLPITYPLQLIISDILKDSSLSSQKENRTQQIFSLDIRLKKPNGEFDADQAAALKKMPLYRFLTRQMLDAMYHEYSVVELSMAQTIEGKTFLVGDSVPRTNIVPITGKFYADYYDTVNGIDYRQLPEFGTWILEFWTKEMPLLNKAVPHVLIKRFAQSCWSELGEIYGIPPRVLKTNTQDKGMMTRAKKMMTDMGAASWFIIDEDESLEFAAGATTNGDVYNNLINLCNNEMCLLIVGAILGQDTKNGSRSKDQVAKDILWLLIQSDMAMLEEQWNNIAIPALKKHGLLTGDLTFEFVPVVNIQELFTRVMAALEYYEIDADWFAEQFGIKVTAVRPQPVPGKAPVTDKKLRYKAESFFA